MLYERNKQEYGRVMHNDTERRHVRSDSRLMQFRIVLNKFFHGKRSYVGIYYKVAHWNDEHLLELYLQMQATALLWHTNSFGGTSIALPFEKISSKIPSKINNLSWNNFLGVRDVGNAARVIFI